MLGTHNELYHLCWLSADAVIGRTLDPISSITTTQELTIEASNSPAALSRLQSGAWHVAGSSTLPHRSIVASPKPAAISP
jgi:hypothetical protein